MPYGYVLTHTMLRIKDPARSLPFYTDVLGMRLYKRVDYPEWKFSLYFLGMPEPDSAPPEEPARLSRWLFQQSGIIELTHNWGSENDPAVRMHNGNDEPQGYGHMCITVPDFRAACERFGRLNVSFHKKPDEGGMKNIAFIRDPDGYRYEIVQSDYLPQVFGD